MIYISYYDSPIGRIILAGYGDFLTGLWFEGQKYEMRGIEKEEKSEKELPVFGTAKKWLDIYFQGKDPGFIPPVKPSGSGFAADVYEILLEIPFGATLSYGEIAEIAGRKRGKKSSARAVGNAVGHNPVSIIIPCHRVVGKDGKMTGYAGGIERKIFLLENEKSLTNPDT